MIVVNFSTSQYARGQQRLKNSLSGRWTMFNNYAEIGSPTHQESPYEFKIHAIKKAAEVDPVVLWMDSSMWVVGDLKVIEDIILTDGHFMTEAGHYVGRWTNAHTRKHFKLTEEELKQEPGGMTMFSAGLLGLDMRTQNAQTFMNALETSAMAGCFRGDWKDHRHDQTCASIIAQRLGMKYQRGGQYMSYIGPGYSPPEPSSIVYLQGI